MVGQTVAYIRVGSDKQNLARQLKAVGVEMQRGPHRHARVSAQTVRLTHCWPCWPAPLVREMSWECSGPTCRPRPSRAGHRT